jgi:hypothetical protein
MSGRKVFFDLETTSLSSEAQIVSIGIVYEGSDPDQDIHLTQYLIPTCKISSGAARIHGMTKENGNLYLNGIYMESAEVITEGLQTFVNILEDIAEGAEDQGILLVGKNISAIIKKVLSLRTCNNIIIIIFFNRLLTTIIALMGPC